MISDKVLKKLPEGFADAMMASDTEDIKKKILESEGHIYEIDKEKEADEKLKAARESLKELGAAYREAKATANAKIKYCMYVLESRGVKM